MRLLLLIRHAKSSWKFPQLEDHDRPLNKRGQRDIALMTDYLNRQDLQIDKIVSSSAKRAISYARYMSEQCNIPLQSERGVYTFSQKALLAEVQSLDPQLKTVAVIAHNPAVTGLLNEITESSIDNMPTSAIAFIRLAIPNWGSTRKACGSLIKVQTPKALIC